MPKDVNGRPISVSATFHEEDKGHVGIFVNGVWIQIPAEEAIKISTLLMRAALYVRDMTRNENTIILEQETPRTDLEERPNLDEIPF